MKSTLFYNGTKQETIQYAVEMQQKIPNLIIKPILDMKENFQFIDENNNFYQNDDVYKKLQKLSKTTIIPLKTIYADINDKDAKEIIASYYEFIKQLEKKENQKTTNE